MRRTVVAATCWCVFALGQLAAQADPRFGGSVNSSEVAAPGGFWTTFEIAAGKESCDGCTSQSTKSLGLGAGGGGRVWRLGVVGRYWFEENVSSDFRAGDVNAIGQLFLGSRSPLYLRAGAGRVFYSVSGIGGHDDSALGGIGIEFPRGAKTAAAFSFEYQRVTNQYGHFLVRRFGVSLVLP